MVQIIKIKKALSKYFPQIGETEAHLLETIDGASLKSVLSPNLFTIVRFLLFSMWFMVLSDWSKHDFLYTNESFFYFSEVY